MIRLLTPMIWIIAVTSVRCVEPPKNAAVVQGSNVTFSCSTEEDNVIRWDYYPQGSLQPTTIYNGRKLAENIDKRIAVDIEGCRSRTCNLSVVNLSLSDAGNFVCFEAAKTIKYLGSLTVIGSTPECSTNLTLPGHPILVEDYLKIDCRVDINGSWTPTIECSPNHGSQMEISRPKHGGVVSSSMTIAARLLDPDTVFTCTTSFNGVHLPNSTVQHASISTNVPEYQHRWYSQPVQVQDRPQDDSSTMYPNSVKPSVSPAPKTQSVSASADKVTQTPLTAAPHTLTFTMAPDKVLIVGLSLVGLLLLAIIIIVILVVVVLSRVRTNKDTDLVHHPLPSPWYGSPAMRGQSPVSEPAAASHHLLVSQTHPIETRPLLNNSWSSPTQPSNSDYGNEFFVRATAISNPNYDRDYIPDPTAARPRAPPGYAAANNGAMLPMHEVVALNARQLQQLQSASGPTDDYLTPSIRVNPNSMQAMSGPYRPTQMQ